MLKNETRTANHKETNETSALAAKEAYAKPELLDLGKAAELIQGYPGLTSQDALTPGYRYCG